MLEDSFVVSFKHLILRREYKEDCRKMGERKVAINKIVNKILCPLEGGLTYFKGLLTQMHKNKKQKPELA